ncbi:hypothetical protein EV356DRAFT_219057 [Viridothelium virens]|uniref:Uncharacterized protein n=1 Tax=Viridothelium virens TaxID=1048519 RepID=A0A6A6HLC7_VIRVR|nr:hypothetical protein EV356DRAFT_219057 [Viridothelium virens]
MSRDSSHTYVHLNQPRIADLFEDFCRTRIAPEDIYVLPQHQPVNPEDEDDVVPDQHAAFGIQRATMRQREPIWRDLGLDELMRKGPKQEEGSAPSSGVKGTYLPR